MSLLRSAWERRAVTTYDGPTPGYGDTGGIDPGQGTWLQGMTWQSWGGSAGVSGAMQLSAVFACLRLLSEAISTLPLDTFSREGDTRVPFRPRPKYLDFAAPQQSRITYLSQVMLSLLTDGNAFVVTVRDEFGAVTDLIVLDPAKIEVTSNGRNEPAYRFGGRTFDRREIMHIPGMMLPGATRGVSPLRAARDVVDSGRSAQDFGAQFMANSAVPPAVIELPEGGGGDQQARARSIAKMWNETHGGTSNAGKVGVLIGGATLKTVAVTPEDAQWLDSKRFGVSEIARFYGVPPHLIADASNSTSWGSGLAEQNLAFGQFALRPWVERIEDAHTRLLADEGMSDAFVKLNMDALLRPSLTDRYASYAIGIQQGFLTPNDARRWEDLPPVPWGDEPPPTPGISPT